MQKLKTRLVFSETRRNNMVFASWSRRKGDNFLKELYAPINWDAASLFTPSASIAYFDLRWDAVQYSAPYGSQFRCYYAPDGDILKVWKLALFEIQPMRDFWGKPYRAYISLETVNFAGNIWGKSWAQINK